MHAAPSPPGAARHRLALPALTLGVVLVTMNVTIVVVALPSLQRDLDAPPDVAAWVVDAFNLAGASLLLLAGYLADRIGRKRVLVAGYLLFTTGALLCALAPSAGFLIAARVLQATGGAPLTPVSLAIVANLYPEPAARARAIGLWGVASGVGLGLGPIVGGSIVDAAGWRAVFAANAVIAAVALALVVRAVPRSRSAVARRLDIPGQAIAALLLVTLTYALIEAPRYGWGSPRIAGLLALDVVLLAAFVVAERRAAEPLIDLGFFRDRQFSGTVAITLAVFFTFAGLVFFGSIDLQRIRGYSPLEAGFLTLPAALPTLAGGPIAGRWVARRGARGILAFGAGLMALGMALLAVQPVDAPVALVLGAFAVVGIGYAVVNAPISTVAVASLPRHRAGVAAAVASTARNVGLVLGIAVLSSVVEGRLPGLVGRALPAGATAAEHAQVLALARGAPRTGMPAEVVAAFEQAYGDAIRSGYAVAAAVGAAACAIALLTLARVPPGQAD